jgi:hypothetical protein
MMANKLLSNGYDVTLHRRSRRRLQHHQGRLLPDGFGPCTTHMVGEPQQQLDRLLGGLKKVFIDNFQGVITRVGTRHDLAQCK